jgi:hypothetical protein
MRKDYRQNFRMGTNPFGKKSNLQKIAETFGPKKKVKKNKKPTKRMFANKGGGADSGRMGEVKSKVTLASDRIKKLLEKLNKPIKGSIKEMLKEEGKKKLLKISEKSPMQKQRVLDKLKLEAQKTGGNVMSADEMRKLQGESEKSFRGRMQKAFSAKKGGLAKKKKKFPDMSGDGKVTMKDILMARGVIPKKKKTKKKVI